MTALEANALFSKYLRSIERWIEKAQASAKERKFEGDVLLHARLAPDQFTFARQVQVACDAAKFAVAKLSGSEPPSHPDTEKTLDELKARIRTCLAYLETFGAERFAGSEDRQCSHPWMQGKWLRGADYVVQYAVPNFLFHVTTAYAILRHNGVPLGKTDYLTPIALQG
ncbi:MAG TPA: DUF1993 domain-containing protein [Kofleriaceae bacterium]|nr:DUF1993 domain-containing protein [Kofleriaceae bacterium]